MAKIRQRDLPIIALLIVGSLALIIGIFALPFYAIYCLFSGKSMFTDESNETECDENPQSHNGNDLEIKNDEEPLEMTREAARARLRAKGFVFHDD